MDDLFELMVAGNKRYFDTKRSYEKYCLRRLALNSSLADKELENRRRNRRTSDSMLDYGQSKHRVQSWVRKHNYKRIFLYL